MRKPIVHQIVLACFLSFISLVLLIPAIILHPLSLRLCRKYTTNLITPGCFLLASTIMEFICRVKFIICGDIDARISKDRAAIIICNHGSLLDTMYMFNLLHKIGCLQRTVFVSHKRFKRVFFSGWLIQLHHFIFINKKWSDDKDHIIDSLRYLSESGPPVHLNIFPEGAIPTETNRQKHKEYSEKNNLPEYTYVMHPKLNGFMHSLKTLREAYNGEVDIFDLTIGYNKQPDPLSHYRSELPNEVHFHISHYPSSSLPISDEDMSEWLKERFREKEQRLNSFYQSYTFPGPVLEDIWRVMASKLALLLKLLFLCGLVIYCLVQSPLLVTAVLGLSLVIHLLVDKWMDGWDMIAIRKWRAAKST